MISENNVVFSGTVQTEQRGETRRRHREADIVQRLARTVSMANPVHCDGRYHRHGIKRGGNRQIGDCGHDHFGDTTTPQGSRPTGIDFTTSSPATSMTEISFDSPLVVSRYFWSGVNARCQTRCPTNRYLRTL